MTAAPKIHVMIVDDHPLFRAGLAVALRRQADLEVVAEASDGAEAIGLAKLVAIDVAIIDMLMPSVSGISLAASLCEIQPRCKILGLSVIDEPCLIADMLRAGAAGFAVKTQPIEEILDAVRTVLGGVRYLPPRVSRDAIERELASITGRPLQRLTPREREVFELVIRGHSSDQIASQLFIARRTVETHRQRVMTKLAAHSIVEMLRVAALHGGLGG